MIRFHKLIHTSRIKPVSTLKNIGLGLVWVKYLPVGGVNIAVACRDFTYRDLALIIAWNADNLNVTWAKYTRLLNTNHVTYTYTSTFQTNELLWLSSLLCQGAWDVSCFWGNFCMSFVSYFIFHSVFPTYDPPVLRYIPSIPYIKLPVFSVSDQLCVSHSYDIIPKSSVACDWLKAAWSLKTRALTEMVYIDEVEVDQEGIADMILDENSIAQVARKYSVTVKWSNYDSHMTLRNKDIILVRAWNITESCRNGSGWCTHSSC